MATSPVMRPSRPSSVSFRMVHSSSSRSDSSSAPQLSELLSTRFLPRRSHTLSAAAHRTTHTVSCSPTESHTVSCCPQNHTHCQLLPHRITHCQLLPQNHTLSAAPHRTTHCQLLPHRTTHCQLLPTEPHTVRCSPKEPHIVSCYPQNHTLSAAAHRTTHCQLLPHRTTHCQLLPTEPHTLSAAPPQNHTLSAAAHRTTHCQLLPHRTTHWSAAPLQKQHHRTTYVSRLPAGSCVRWWPGCPPGPRSPGSVSGGGRPPIPWFLCQVRWRPGCPAGPPIPRFLCQVAAWLSARPPDPPVPVSGGGPGCPAGPRSPCSCVRWRPGCPAGPSIPRFLCQVAAWLSAWHPDPPVHVSGGGLPSPRSPGCSV